MARHAAPSPIAPETALLPVIVPRKAHVLGQYLPEVAQYTDLAAQNVAYFQQTGTHEDVLFAQDQFEASSRQTRAMLDEVRGRVAEAPDEPGIDQYLNRTFGGMLARARAQGAPHNSVRDWLVDKEQGATNHQLYGFITAHIEHIANRQTSPELQEVFDRAKAIYIDGVEHAVDMGVYVPEARQSLEKVRQARIIVGDYWDRMIMSGALAYRIMGRDYVVVGQNLDDVPEGMAPLQEILVHELDHLQFLDDMVREGMPTHFWEAMAEHSKRSIREGYWHTINPYLRPGGPKDPDIFYVEDRILQDSINNDGAYKIDPMLAVRAHSAPAGHPAWDEYLRAIYKAWGVQIHTWAQERIDQYSDELKATGVVPELARDIAFSRVRSEMHRSEKGKLIARAAGASAIKSRRHGSRRR